MIDLLNTLAIVAVATLFGSMAFFSCVVAPLTFIKLEAAVAGRFVRSLFPWYYVVIGLSALIAAAALAVVGPFDAAAMGLVALGAFVSRQILMPRINHHRDRALGADSRATPSAEAAFARLHRLSVWINAAQLIATLVVLVRLGLA